MVTESPAGFNHVRSTATATAATATAATKGTTGTNKHLRESCVCQQVEQMSIAKKHGPKLNVLYFMYIYIYIYNTILYSELPDLCAPGQSILTVFDPHHHTFLDICLALVHLCRLDPLLVP